MEGRPKSRGRGCAAPTEDVPRWCRGREEGEQKKRRARCRTRWVGEVKWEEREKFNKGQGERRGRQMGREHGLACKNQHAWCRDPQCRGAGGCWGLLLGAGEGRGSKRRAAAGWGCCWLGLLLAGAGHWLARLGWLAPSSSPTHDPPPKKGSPPHLHPDPPTPPGTLYLQPARPDTHPLPTFLYSPCSPRRGLSAAARSAQIGPFFNCLRPRDRSPNLIFLG